MWQSLNGLVWLGYSSSQSHYDNWDGRASELFLAPFGIADKCSSEANRFHSGDTIQQKYQIRYSVSGRTLLSIKYFMKQWGNPAGVTSAEDFDIVAKRQKERRIWHRLHETSKVLSKITTTLLLLIFHSNLLWQAWSPEERELFQTDSPILLQNCGEYLQFIRCISAISPFRSFLQTDFVSIFVSWPKTRKL